MSTKRLPSLFRKKSERFPGDGYDLPRTQSRAPADEPSPSRHEAASAASGDDPPAEPDSRESAQSAHAATQPVDMATELQNQLQSAMWRCNNLEARLDRALRETAVAKEHRDALLASLAQAEAKAEKSERESQWKGAELDRMRRELGEEREKREAAERELDQQTQQVELLEWKLQEKEEHAVGLRSLAAQAEGSMELARAEILAVEAKCKEEVAQAREDADAEVTKMKLMRDEAQERVGWLERELTAAQGRVSLSEFRLREEASRCEALVAEADELTEKLREAEDLLEVCYREYGVPRRRRQQGGKQASVLPPLPESAHRLDSEQGPADCSGTSLEQPSREQQLLQEQQRRSSEGATSASSGGRENTGVSCSGNTGELSGSSEQQSSSQGSEPGQRRCSSSSPSFHSGTVEGVSRDREEAEVTSLRLVLNANHDSSGAEVAHSN